MMSHYPNPNLRGRETLNPSHYATVKSDNLNLGNPNKFPVVHHMMSFFKSNLSQKYEESTVVQYSCTYLKFLANLILWLRNLPTYLWIVRSMIVNDSMLKSNCTSTKTCLFK